MWSWVARKFNFREKRGKGAGTETNRERPPTETAFLLHQRAPMSKKCQKIVGQTTTTESGEERSRSKVGK